MSATTIYLRLYSSQTGQRAQTVERADMLKSVAAGCFGGAGTGACPVWRIRVILFSRKLDVSLVQKTSVEVFKVNKWGERDQSLRKQRHYAKKLAYFQAWKEEGMMHGGWESHRLPVRRLVGMTGWGGGGTGPALDTSWQSLIWVLGATRLMEEYYLAKYLPNLAFPKVNLAHVRGGNGGGWDHSRRAGEKAKESRAETALLWSKMLTVERFGQMGLAGWVRLIIALFSGRGPCRRRWIEGERKEAGACSSRCTWSGRWKGFWVEASCHSRVSRAGRSGSERNICVPSAYRW